MSHKKQRRAARRPPVPAPVPVPQALAVPYTHLLSEIERAQAAARDPAEVDLRGAVKLLNEHPALLAFLEGVHERSEARSAALTAQGPADWARWAVPGTAPPDFLQRGPGSQAALDTDPRNRNAAGGGWASQKAQPQGVPNARLLREWADTNEWVRAAINSRKQQVGRADIAVVPLDERKPYNRTLMKQIQVLLDQPNEYLESYRSLIEPVIEDLLVLDRGVIEKNLNLKRQPVALYAQDGGTIKIFPDWNGSPDDPRYLYEDPNTGRKAPLLNDQAIVMCANPGTYRLCLSPVQVLRNTIRADLAAMQSAMHIVEMKPPPHAIQIPGMSKQMLTQLRNEYEATIAGRREILFLGGDNEAKVFPLVFSAKDNQWLEWQTWLARKICAVFSISPQQIGITFDINKSTADSQQQIFEDTGLIPLLLLLEEYLNRELLACYAGRIAHGRANLAGLNLRIVYPEVSEAARQLHYEKAARMGQLGLQGLPSMTLNQVLALRGEEPVPGGNTFYVKTAHGAVPWLSYDGVAAQYTPSAAQGGLEGGQDPAGGPVENDDATAGGDGGAGADAPAFNDATGDAESGPAAANSDLSSGYQMQANAVTTAPTLKALDTRAPGKAWSARDLTWISERLGPT